MGKSAVGAAFEAGHDRDVALDGVRGLALVTVFVIHCFNPVPLGPVSSALHAIADSGWLAIDLFFVLSGYLITAILLRTRGQADYFRNFYARRALRIFPAYYLVVVFAFYVYPRLWPTLGGIGLEAQAPYYLLYVQNWAMVAQRGGMVFPGVDHMWSMAIEEQFYLVWPLLVALVPPARLARLCVLLICCSIAAKFVLVASHAGWGQIYVATITRLDGLAAGAWVAVRLFHQPASPPPRWLRTTAGAALAILLAVFVAKRGLHINSPTQIAICTSAASLLFATMIHHVVTAPVRDPLRRLLGSRPLVFLGIYSYGIYLIHWVIYWQLRLEIEAALPGLPVNLVVVIVGLVVTGLSIVLAMAMYHAVEQPALRLKRFFASRATTQQPSIDIDATVAVRRS